MPGPRVKCEVNTCTHWVPGDYCAAGNIDILNEEEGKMSRYAEHTECKTFSNRRGLANLMGSIDNVNWGGMLSEPFLPGQQLTPTVTCVVDSCRYWANGNRCDAGDLEISGQEANECQDTNCETFEPK